MAWHPMAGLHALLEERERAWELAEVASEAAGKPWKYRHGRMRNPHLEPVGIVEVVLQRMDDDNYQ